MIAKTGKHTEHVTNAAFGNLHVATTKLGPEVLASGWPEVGGVQRGQMSIAWAEGAASRSQDLEEPGCSVLGVSASRRVLPFERISSHRLYLLKVQIVSFFF